MTPRIRVELSDTGCQKPGCKHKFSGAMHRHHKRHEKTWVNLWTRMGPPSRMRRGEESTPDICRRLFLLLKDRYYQFRPQDTVRLCEWHHVEIHVIYRRIIYDVQVSSRSLKAGLTFREAMLCMYRCRKACDKWMKKKTPGLHPGRAKKRGEWS